jgi:hypothetical protein
MWTHRVTRQQHPTHNRIMYEVWFECSFFESVCLIDRLGSSQAANVLSQSLSLRTAVLQNVVLVGQPRRVFILSVM